METTPKIASIEKAYGGLRVLDISQGIAGPYCAQILQQLGADVIKFEPPEGDWSRAIGTAYEGMSALSIAYNRGKKSIGCNARVAEGRNILFELAKRADVVVQSFRPGVAERLGVGFSDVASTNPRAVYVSISGFGLDGPYVDRPATDAVVQALTGLAVANSGSDGTPQTAKPYVADVSCGLYAAQAVSAALYMRERTGQGTHLNISLLASLAALQSAAIIDHVLRDGAPTKAGTTPQGVFATSDGYIVLAAMNDAMFIGICNVLERDDWRSDPRLKTQNGRLDAVDEITSGVSLALRAQSSEFWLAQFGEADVLAARVNNYDQFMNDPQVQHLDLLQSMTYTNLPVGLKCSNFPGVSQNFQSKADIAPFLGEHTREVLQELGYDAAQVAELASSGAIVCRP